MMGKTWGCFIQTKFKNVTGNILKQHYLRIALTPSMLSVYNYKVGNVSQSIGILI